MYPALVRIYCSYFNFRNCPLFYKFLKYYIYIFFCFFFLSSLRFESLPPSLLPPPLPCSFSGNHANKRNCFFFWLPCFLDLLPHSFSGKIHPRLISENIHTKTPRKTKKNCIFFSLISLDLSSPPAPVFSSVAAPPHPPAFIFREPYKQKKLLFFCSCVFNSIAAALSFPSSPSHSFSGMVANQKNCFSHFLLPCFLDLPPSSPLPPRIRFLPPPRPILVCFPRKFLQNPQGKPKKLLFFCSPCFLDLGSAVRPQERKKKNSGRETPNPKREKIFFPVGSFKGNFGN